MLKLRKKNKNRFNKIVRNLDINRNAEYVRQSFNDLPVLVSIENMIFILVLKTLKVEWMTLIQIYLLNFSIKIKFLKKLKS